MERIGVVGCGLMGSGIAEVTARAGAFVTVIESDEDALKRGQDRIEKSLSRAVGSNKMSEDDASHIRDHLTYSTDFGDLADRELVIEAVAENEDIKLDVFRKIDASVVDPGAILATNTSSIPIIKLAMATKRPEQVIGMHFFNPVPVMQLVEVIRGLQTSQATFDEIFVLSQQLGKTPVEVNDAAGFISNRVLMPLINEAIYAVTEGVATAEAVDQVFVLGMAHPMGPLTLADFIGLDVCLDIMRVLSEGLGNQKYNPCPLLIRMVDAGWLGRKSGRGFYTY
jgi:3-hydroxybutyryl-CoA dehydrogenase